jgi:hypothetical protein
MKMSNIIFAMALTAIVSITFPGVAAAAEGEFDIFMRATAGGTFFTPEGDYTDLSETGYLYGFSFFEKKGNLSYGLEYLNHVLYTLDATDVKATSVAMVIENKFEMHYIVSIAVAGYMDLPQYLDGIIFGGRVGAGYEFDLSDQTFLTFQLRYNYIATADPISGWEGSISLGLMF